MIFQEIGAWCLVWMLLRTPWAGFCAAPFLSSHQWASKRCRDFMDPYGWKPCNVISLLWGVETSKSTHFAFLSHQWSLEAPLVGQAGAAVLPTLPTQCTHEDCMAFYPSRSLQFWALPFWGSQAVAGWKERRQKYFSASAFQWQCIESSPWLTPTYMTPRLVLDSI